MMENPHKNHRARMQQRFEQNGLAGFHDHEVLEVLLYYALPRVDTNPIAHRLLERFGSLHNILEASPDVLREVEGMGPGAARLISFVGQLSERYQTDKIQMPAHACLCTFQQRWDYFYPLLSHKQKEELWATFVNAQGVVIRSMQCSVGTATQVELKSAEIARNALLCNARGVILAHNHPDGCSRPSAEDIQATQLIRAQLELLQIELIDHCIVTRKNVTSIIDFM